MTSSEISVFETHRIRICGKLRSAYQYVVQDELNHYIRLKQKLNNLLYWTLRVSEQTVFRLRYLNECANLTEDFVGIHAVSNYALGDLEDLVMRKALQREIT